MPGLGRLGSGFGRCPLPSPTSPETASGRPGPGLEYWYNIARWTEMPSGGHFASLEAPELYVEDAVDYFAGLG
ncbi:MAG: hypothetical protein OXG50_00220 [bacterium]|nr:hypothetical protein [bacterium]